MSASNRRLTFFYDLVLRLRPGLIEWLGNNDETMRGFCSRSKSDSVDNCFRAARRVVASSRDVQAVQAYDSHMHKCTRTHIHNVYTMFFYNDEI